MVVFVLDGAQQAIRLEFDNLIFQASGFHPDRKGTDDIAADSGHAQAAFDAGVFPSERFNLRITQSHGSKWRLVTRLLGPGEAATDAVDTAGRTLAVTNTDQSP